MNLEDGGSQYYNWHVKSKDVRQVSGQIRQVLERSGLRRAREPLDESGKIEITPGFRGLALTRARHDWVSVLDGSYGQMPQLATQVAAELDPHGSRQDVHDSR